MPRRRVRLALPSFPFLAIVAGCLAFLVASDALARKFTLPELLDMARRGNPGIKAGGAAAAAMEAQVVEAKRNWLPSGEFLTFVAPVPRIECRDVGTAQTTDNRDQAEGNCITTNANPRDDPSILTKIKGAWWRSEIKLVQPLWDFGKISAGVEAAEAGVAALRQKQAGTAEDVDQNVRRAYYGVKLARELLDTLEQGVGYLNEAQDKIEKQLAEGSGTATVTDRLRLRTVRAEVDARVLEATRLRDLALNGLRTLVGSEAVDDLDVDEEPLEPLEVGSRPITYYEEQARWNRPESRALEYAVKAKNALSDLERRREYPDLVLVATGSFAYAPTIDTPKNAYYNNPFNTIGAGISAALRVPLDFGPKLARADRVRAEAEEMELKRREALGGILLDVQKSFGEMTEAAARVEAVQKGEKAGKTWITAVAQNFAVGLAEARDFSDALVAFFQMRARYLQAVFDLNVAAAALERATGGHVP